jgi:predicted membrane-bound dolichyl-phosphate-mannose-protein mannosyltransferase
MINSFDNVSFQPLVKLSFDNFIVKLSGYISTITELNLYADKNNIHKYATHEHIAPGFH